MSEFTTIKGSNSYRGSSTWEQDVVHNVVSVELPTTALQTGDITWLLYVPEGAIIVDGFVKADDLDGGTSLAYNIGDSTTTNLFFADTTTGQSAGSSAITSTARYTKFASVSSALICSALAASISRGILTVIFT
jgi:hypothetical protein